jgi:DNA-binding NarL/FixJ family response regulator
VSSDLAQVGLASLTPTEVRTLAAIASGKQNKTIARETGRSITTVRTHTQAILSKLGVESQLQAAIVFWEINGGPSEHQS